MKAKELRIGNWLKRADDSEFKVDGNDIKIISEWKNIFAPLPDSIPLTEEWLLRFGFEKQSKYFYFNNSYRIEQMLNGEMCFRIRVNGSESHPIAIINYVNELQNLYFALTGKELELTPQK